MFRFRLAFTKRTKFRKKIDKVTAAFTVNHRAASKTQSHVMMCRRHPLGLLADSESVLNVALRHRHHQGAFKADISGATSVGKSKKYS